MYQNQPQQPQQSPPQQQQWQQQPPMQQNYQAPVQQAPVAAPQEGTSNLVQGRIVWMIGSNIPEGRQKVNQDTNQVEVDPKTGSPILEYGFGLAVAKNSPEYQKMMSMLNSEALKLYPSGQIPPNFAMKFKDGDTDFDEKGVPYNQREGYAGHIVVACTTRLTVKLFKWENGNNVQVASGVKSGDYVTVQLNVKAHLAVGRGKPGLYVNPSAVQLIAAGKEIINKPSGDQMFSTSQPQFQGQMVQETAPTFPVQGQMQQAPNPNGYNPGFNSFNQQPPAQAPYQQPAQAAPHYGVMPDQFQQQNPAQAQYQQPPQQQWNQQPPQNQQQWGQQPVSANTGMPPVPPR